jgi:DNA-binding response OmpR family regulator
LTISARHLLVVDDEPHIGLVLRPFLEQLGYRVSIAKTLGEARTAMRAMPATDGLLLDIHLPDGSGLDFLRDLRNQRGTARMPVLVLTAEGEDRILREARRLGAALVTKPFSPTKLSQRIAMMFGDADADFPDSDSPRPGGGGAPKSEPQ